MVNLKIDFLVDIVQRLSRPIKSSKNITSLITWMVNLKMIDFLVKIVQRLSVAKGEDYADA